MFNKNKSYKRLSLKKLISSLFLLISLVVLFVVVGRIYFWKSKDPSIVTASTLEKAIDISELSTIEYTYNGIAQVYEEDEEPICHIKYNAKVKAGINIKNVHYEVDQERKTVRVLLPEITIKSNIVDGESLSFVPPDTSIDFQQALLACEQDVKEEVLKFQELFDSAEENLKATLEGLLFPILDPGGYKIVWE